MTKKAILLLQLGVQWENGADGEFMDLAAESAYIPVDREKVLRLAAGMDEVAKRSKWDEHFEELVYWDRVWLSTAPVMGGEPMRLRAPDEEIEGEGVKADDYYLHIGHDRIYWHVLTAGDQLLRTLQLSPQDIQTILTHFGEGV